MNKLNNKLAGMLLVLALSFSVVPQIYAAQNKPVELTADTIDYDSVKGIVTAQGGVRVTQENAVLTGASAEYNTKTQETYITGGVKAVKDDAVLTCAEVRSYDNTHLVATGDALLVKGDNSLSGPKIDYYSDKDYAIVPANGHLTTPDGFMTADKIEAFLKEDRAVSTGNVHVVSDVRKLDATSDVAVYYGAKYAAQDERGKVVLTGNARAVQDGNVLTGNTLTIRLDDKAMDAQGRTKLVIVPK